MDEIDSLLQKVKEATKEIEGKTGKVQFLEKQIETLKSSLQQEMTVGEYYDLGEDTKRLQKLNAEAEKLKQEVNNLLVDRNSLESTISKILQQQRTVERLGELKKELSSFTDLPPVTETQANLHNLYQELSAKSVVAHEPAIVTGKQIGRAHV